MLFDLDGTLLDSGAGILASHRHTLGALGLPVDEHRLRALIGPPLEVALAELGVPPPDVARAVRIYRRYYLADGMLASQLYPGVPELLARVAAAGIPMGLATSKLESSALALVDHFGIGDHFGVVSGATADGSRSHKHEVIGDALSRAGRRGGRDVIMVGDRSYDVQGARSHGCTPVGAAWGYGDPGELVDAGAAMVAADPRDLGDHLLDDHLLGSHPSPDVH